jgi:hypothetical protein
MLKHARTSASVMLVSLKYGANCSGLLLSYFANVLICAAHVLIFQHITCNQLDSLSHYIITHVHFYIWCLLE